MKTLILSTRTGQGHNSASRAVALALKAAGHEAEVADLLHLGRRDVSGRISRLYAGVTTHTPRLMGLLYHLGGKVSRADGRSPIYLLNTLSAGRLRAVIEAEKPDVLLCPHIFSAQAVTHLKRQGLGIPAVGLDTDYTCCPFWEETRLDRYIVPAEKVALEFADHGVPENKVVPIGIPVGPEFCAPRRRAEARAVFGVHAPRAFLVMGGSMGFGRMLELARRLIRLAPEAETLLLCADNRRLLAQARRLRDSGERRLIPLGYVRDIPLLMDAADVLLTKPGGLSSTEAVQKRVPVVFTAPIPDGEEENARFLETMGAGLYEPEPRKAARCAVELLRDPAARERMLAKQRRHFPPDAAARVARLLIETAQAAKPAGKEGP